MDVSFSERSERPLRPVQFRLLGDLEFFRQLSGGEEPPDSSVYPHFRGFDLNNIDYQWLAGHLAF